MEEIFKGLFDGSTVAVIKVGDFMLCVLSALLIGVILALCYIFRHRYTKSFVITLATLPAVVCVVIMMVNGNLGAGVAVAGAFSLVRFRSVPGTARDIGMLFLAMGAGLIVGMGYIAYAILFTLILGAAFVLYNQLCCVGPLKGGKHRSVRITIPEDLEYTDVFKELFDEYTTSHELCQVKTTNMGSMFRLTYNVALKDVNLEKEFIDRIRERNGNLEITVSKQEGNVTEL